MQELTSLLLFEAFIVFIIIIIIWFIKKEDKSFYDWYIYIKDNYFSFLYEIRNLFILSYIWSTLLSLLMLLISISIWFLNVYNFTLDEIMVNKDLISKILVESEIRKLSEK